MSFSLTYSFMGGAPASGGTSRLSVSSRGGNYVIIAELVGEGPDYRRNGAVPAEHGWRGVVAYLMANRIVAYDTDGDTTGEYPFPHLMVLKGRSSLATDMVALTWAGEPLVQFIQAISRQPGEEIERLRERYGSLRSEAFVNDLMRFRHWADELLVDPDDVIARGPRFGWNFREMRRDLVRWARVMRAEEEAARLRRRWELAPFEPQIKAVVMAWRRENPGGRGNAQMGQAVRIGSLRKALETYVIEHHSMPDGAVTVVPEKWVGPFTIDVGKLLETRAAQACA